MRSQVDKDYNNLNNTLINKISLTRTTMTTNNSTNSNNDHDQQQQQQHEQQTNSSTSVSTTTNNSTNCSKIQVLKLKKTELEKILNEKNLLLQQIQKQEAQIINGNLDNFIETNNNNAILRRKVGTSFKLPKHLSNEDSEIENLLLDKKVQQEICNNSFKLSNDPNISKSIRRSHKADYEMAQQRLITINHNLSILKKRQSTSNLSIQIKSNSLSGSINCLNSLKSCQQHEQPINNNYDNYNNTLTINSNNYKLNNNNNNIKNTTTERRNSIKSTTALLTINNNNNNSNFDKTLKSHRSDYDLNNLYNQKSTIPNNLISSTTSSPFINNNQSESNNINNNSLTVQQYHKIIDNFENYNNNQHYHYNNNNQNYFNTIFPDNINNYYNNNTNNTNNKYCKNRVTLNLSTDTTANILQSDKYYFSPTQLQYDNNKSGGGFIKSSRNIRQQGTPTIDLAAAVNCINNEQQQQDQLQNNQSNINIREKYLNNDHNNILYDNNNIMTSTYHQSVITDDNNCSDEQHLQQSTGLGGYWRTIPTSNDRVWCAFENSYDNKSQHQIKSKKLDNLNSQQFPSKSSSLSNFDIISLKDDSIDKISISSINSDTSKSKLKEKQWLETSLDGPLIRVKAEVPQQQQLLTFDIQQSKEQNSISSVYNNNNNQNHQSDLLLTNYNHHNNYNNNSSINNQQLSPITQHRHNSYRERSKLLSKSMSQRIQSIKLEDVSSYLSHSTSVLNSESITYGGSGSDIDNNYNEKQYINYIKDRQILQQQQQQQQHMISSPLSSNSSRIIDNQYQINNFQKTNHINTAPGLQIQKQSSPYSLRNSYARPLNTQQLSPQQNYHYHHQNHISSKSESPLLLSSSQNLGNLIIDNNNYNNNNFNLSIDILPSSSSSSSIINNSPTTILSVATNNNNNNNTSLASGTLSPDIRIESPKNMTIVQQATFMPYKEVSKPFEMSDFYKYSTKFRQRDITIGGSTITNNGNNLINSNKLPMPLPANINTNSVQQQLE